jgi:3-hydroxyisobutyrate dehydrogenase-like beta-hydroxyacid dehydrogenase
MKIGFIGAGRMGRPILDQLASGGHAVRVLARSEERKADAARDGLASGESVARTVRDAGVVFVVVLDDQQVRAVCLGRDGALAAMPLGSTLVIHTTCNPETVRAIAVEGGMRGIRLLDAALSGGPLDIAAGSLTLWVGGDEMVLDEVRPLLELYSSPIRHVGPVGNGQLTKLVNNALFVAQVGLAVDAVRVAGCLGIDSTEILAAVQDGSGASRALSIVAQLATPERIGDALGDLMLKDVTVVRDVAARMGTDLGLIGEVLCSPAVEKVVLRSSESGATA